MAVSKYKYVRDFEEKDEATPNNWIVIRLDGKCFHRFADTHGFQKPNDETALRLMNQAARKVMTDFTDIVLAYGQSDEYSFVLQKQTKLYKRRKSKLLSNVCSLFASSYAFYWNEFFPDKRLQYPPTFDGRLVLYPSEKNLKDYFRWRQADCHINNLYNTIFWALVQRGKLTATQAEERLRGTFAADKNELLFSEFGINYSKEPELFRKGTVFYRNKKSKKKAVDEGNETCSSLQEETVDIIGELFWKERFLIDAYCGE